MTEEQMLVKLMRTNMINIIDAIEYAKRLKDNPVGYKEVIQDHQVRMQIFSLYKERC